MLRILRCVCPQQRLSISNIHLSASKVEANAAGEDIKFDYINNTGIIELNKPNALNLLTLDMVQRIYQKMKEWESDGITQIVLIKGAGSKAFCAGGDLRTLLRTNANGENVRRDCFKELYQLNYLTGTYKLPYIALINGITMGGGCGLSLHGPFRVVTETTKIAMPEAAVGLFPDAGASHFLSRLSDSVGVFLGLTGYRLCGSDAVHVGLATHFISSNRLPKIQQKLVENPASVKEVLDKNSESVKAPFSLASQLPLINRIFSLNTKNVESILDQLKSDGSEFALKQYAILEKMSPTSLKLTFEQMKRGKNVDLKECFKMEYRMAQRIIKGHDFFEGVQAVLVEKNRKPRWQPSSLIDVSDQDIAHYFEKLPVNEELQLDG